MFVSVLVFVLHVRHARKSVVSGGRTDITTQRSSAPEEITDFTITTSTRPFRTSVSGKVRQDHIDLKNASSPNANRT